MKNKTPKLNFLSKNFKVLRLVFKFCPQLLYLSIIYIFCAVATSVLKVYLISVAITHVLEGLEFIGLISKVLYILIIELICLFFNKFIFTFFFSTHIAPLYLINNTESTT